MGRVVDFARYQCARPPHSVSETQPDSIEFILLPDGTYEVTYRGQYAGSRLLAAEHLADALLHITIAIRDA
ncbi:hypothetical protein DFLDMN_001519 [Cupriavidus sp. H19C3]|uniref:hypothetical protein n=1 Tax=Cupriavidus sp. H19C3 TaxID=3241603 RepID=UPI003BF85BD0